MTVTSNETSARVASETHKGASERIVLYLSTPFISVGRGRIMASRHGSCGAEFVGPLSTRHPHCRRCVERERKREGALFSCRASLNDGTVRISIGRQPCRRETCPMFRARCFVSRTTRMSTPLVINAASADETRVARAREMQMRTIYDDDGEVSGANTRARASKLFSVIAATDKQAVVLSARGCNCRQSSATVVGYSRSEEHMH